MGQLPLRCRIRRPHLSKITPDPIILAVVPRGELPSRNARAAARRTRYTRPRASHATTPSWATAAGSVSASGTARSRPAATPGRDVPSASRPAECATCAGKVPDVAVPGRRTARCAPRPSQSRTTAWLASDVSGPLRCPIVKKCAPRCRPTHVPSVSRYARTAQPTHRASRRRPADGSRPTRPAPRRYRLAGLQPLLQEHPADRPCRRKQMPC